MDHIYKYAILIATPSERRGERVNVGIVVFRDGAPDVRFMHAATKLRVLTRDSWDARLDAAKERLADIAASEQSPAAALERFALYEPLVTASGLGSLSAHDADDYEAQVGQILNSLVAVPPKARGAEAATRINTEIANVLKGVIAPKGVGVEENKVVRDFEIDAKQGLRADFALKNGVMHVIATLDLRRQDVDLGPPAVKSLMLDEALKKFGKGKVKRFGAYAVEAGKEDQFSQHLTILGNHAVDGLWDWNSRDDRNRLRKSIYDALEHDDPLV